MLQRLAGFGLVNALTFGCAAPPPPAPPTTNPKLEAAPATASIDVAHARRSATNAAPPPTPVELSLATPDDLSCTLRADTWTGDLRMRPGDPPFARVHDVATTLRLPKAANEPAHLTVDASLALRGVADDSPIFLARPVALGGFAVPRNQTSLGWESAGVAGRVIVTLDVSDLFVEPKTVRHELSCNGVAMTPQHYDARGFLGPEEKDGRLLSDELFAKPDGERVGRLQMSKAASLAIAERRGGWTRVVFEAERYVVSGWSSQVAVQDIQSLDMQMLGRLRGVEIGDSIHSSHASFCVADIDLIVEMNGARSVVGRLKRDTRFLLEAGPPGYQSLRLSGSWLALAGGAKLLVRESDLSVCFPRRRHLDP